MEDSNKVRVGGRAIGYVEHRSQQGGYYQWRDDTGNGPGRAFDSYAEAEESLIAAYEEACERFGRNAHASHAA